MKLRDITSQKLVTSKAVFRFYNYMPAPVLAWLLPYCVPLCQDYSFEPGQLCQYSDQAMDWMTRELNSQCG